VALSRLSTRLTIARRDLSGLSREKTIVLALFIQLTIAAFSSFLVVGLASLYDPGSVSEGDVTAAVTGPEREALFAAADEQEGLEPVPFANETTARRAFERGSVRGESFDALLVADTRQGRIDVEATVPQGSLRTTLVVVQVRETLERIERDERERRSEYLDHDLVPVPSGVSSSPYFGFSYTLLVPLLLFLPVFISGSVTVDAITEEVEHGTLELLRTAPVSLTTVVDGKGAAMAALAPAQAVLWVALLGLNGIAIANVGLLVVLVSALALFAVALGAGISLLVPTRQRAQLLYSMGVLLLFGSSLLLPEHPATTVARLAIDSAGPLTRVSVAGYVVLAVGLAVGVRALAGRVDPERL